MATKIAPLDDTCTECGLWIDPKWRACPTCGTRTASAAAIDQRERIAAIAAIVGGAAFVVASFLTWARTTGTPTGTETTTGMSGGRGILTLVIGVIALAIGATALMRRRFAGNRATLVFMGIVGIAYWLAQRNLIAKHLDDVKFKVASAQPRDGLSHAATTVHAGTSYGFGLWLFVLASLVLIVAAILLPRQLSPRDEPVVAVPQAA